MKRAFFLLLLIACAAPQPQAPVLKELQGPPPAGVVQTIDGTVLAYDIYPNPGKPAVILIHMLQRDRHDLDLLAKYLQRNGFAVLTYDMRGHGQSSGDWHSFTADDFSKLGQDITAVKGILALNDADITRLTLVGASIGANAALAHAAQDPNVATVVALSPGLDYRGVLPPAVLEQPVLLVASAEDAYSYDSVQTLKKTYPHAQAKLYNGAGHGTAMLTQQDLMPGIRDWMFEYS